MKKISLLLIIFSFLISGCGFKVLDNSKRNDFLIKNISSSGEKRINYKIKSFLLSNTNSGSQNNRLILNLFTKKNKSIKEKNIKNEVSKYSLEINVTVNLDLLDRNFKKSFNVSAKGDYLVGKTYSSTLTNEKKTMENIVEEVSNDIIEKIGIILNDI